MESTLRTQIIEAIEEDYLTSLRDPHTDMIHHSIPRIFNFLKINYGQISPQQLKQRETEMDNMVYDPSSHVNSVFNKLQEFQDICNLVDQPKQDYQMVNMAYIIFQKCPIFKDSLIRWNRRVQENSYNDFKNFMRQEYNELAKVGGLTVGSTFGQSVNLVQHIDDIKHHTERVTNDMKQEIRDTLQAFYMNTNEPPYWNPPTSGVQKTEEETTFHNMLAVQQQQTLTIQQLSKQLLALQTQLNN